MDWEAIGAIGEVVGALGVLITLIFLIIQIRQNSGLVRNNTLQLEQNNELAKAQAIGESNSQQDAMLAIAQSDTLSQIFQQGLASYADLEQLDKMRFALAMGAMMGGVATQTEQQISLGVYENAMAPPHLEFVSLFLNTPGGRKWWDKHKRNYSPRFRNLVDERLEQLNS